MKKIIIYILSAILLFASTVSACADPNDEKTVTQKTTFQGVHDFTATDTNDFIVKNGINQGYQIVFPSKYTEKISDAVEELKYFFKIATGVSLNSIPDSKLTGKEGKYISIGNTTLLQENNISVDAEREKYDLGTDGVRIQTVSSNVFLYGGADPGSLYAVYDFLKIMFNYECYYYDTFEIDKEVKNVPLKNFAVVDVPDIGLRWVNYGAYTNNTSTYDGRMYQNRMRLGDHHNNYELPIHHDLEYLVYLKSQEAGKNEYPNGFQGFAGREFFHNTAAFFPDRSRDGKQSFDKNGNEYWYGYFDAKPQDYVDKYLGEWGTESYDEFFSITGDRTQICYTGQGVEYPEERTYHSYFGVDYAYHTARELMVLIAADKICASLDYYDPVRYPDYNQVFICMEDTHDICQCQECLKWKQIYGTDSGVVITFCNDVNKLVQQYMKDNPDKARKDFKVMFSAYYELVDAPAHYDSEQGKYVPNHPDVVCDDGVGVFYCLSSGACFQKSIYDELSDRARTNTEKWNVLTDTMWFWLYENDFEELMFPMDSFPFFNADSYQFFAANGAKGLYSSGQNGGYATVKPTSHTGFVLLKLYLNPKLEWDSSLDMDDLIENWFSAMYGEAKDYMFDLFNKQKLHYAYICGTNEYYIEGQTLIDIEKKEYWPYNLLSNWLDILDDAYAAIAKYEKTDYELFTKLSMHIDAEWVLPAYNVLDFYGDEANNVEEIKANMIFRVERLGSLNISDHVAIGSFIESLKK